MADSGFIGTSCTAKEQRSYNTSVPYKGKDTKPEMLVRWFLHANGFRNKLHDKILPGKPV
jgi:DNA mismatch endonuclease (patch repair protein)